MADPDFTLDEIPGVDFEVAFGSGGEPGLPSTWLRIVGTIENPYYEPAFDYTGTTWNADTDPWKRHEERVVVCRMGIGPQIEDVLPAAPPPTGTTPDPVDAG
ncbi:hypothetical protein SEA_VANLEE_23 [Gordonia phage VanLee]|uniref:Uncharacterized protein n=1 Tax=Gordonia phage VanLee TaxID=2845816 RepID=A0A8F2IFE1_9CAUD|nr:hypothetical protein QEH49_gp023 [Gordonia phage VanLee]QWS68141.1 hypothetical protein SEA_VANLEE_23 [Gordonia phage VanLee]